MSLANYVVVLAALGAASHHAALAAALWSWSARIDRACMERVIDALQVLVLTDAAVILWLPLAPHDGWPLTASAMVSAWTLREAIRCRTNGELDAV